MTYERKIIRVQVMYYNHSYVMKKIINLSELFGGKVVAQDWCTAMQNEANTKGHTWTAAFWDEWATVYEQGGCLHAVVTP